MNEHTKKQCGSPSRDLFKLKHKELDRSLYGCDIDFCIVTKNPFPDIVAVLDYKKAFDEITFSEVIAYNALMMRGIDVYIVCGDAEIGRFEISKYAGGNHQKPRYSFTDVVHVKDWKEYEAWEHMIRGKHFMDFKA